MQSRLLVVVLALAPSLTGQAYESNFEALSASTSGTLLTGQDGYYLPAVAGSVDWNAFPYTGNALSIPQNLLGGAQFVAGQSLGGTSLARAQRPLAFDANQPWRSSIDFCANFLGTPPSTDYLGSISIQPANALILLLSWNTNTANPVLFNISIQTADVVGTLTIAIVPDANFQNLNILQWYRLEAAFDFATNRVTELAITNLNTFARNAYLPTGWYMVGGATPAPPWTDFRMFAGGSAGNVVAIDNVSFAPAAAYTPFGNGCQGSLGVPTLAVVPNALPIPGFTFSAVVTNLPISVAIMAAGFSNSVSGPFTLPLSLTPYGLTGCTLYVDPAVTQLLLGASNQAFWNLPLPNNAGLLNMRLYSQAFSLDTLANPVGLTVSNAGKLIVGR